MPRDHDTITSDLLLQVYAAGLFPMAEGRDDPEILWFDPQRRGVMPLDGFRMSRSLSKKIGRGMFEVTLNRDFPAVVAACADRPETWINHEIEAAYVALHGSGFAHSIEVWQDDTLVGGLYGVALGAGFFGESMFSRARDASKVAMAYTVALLRRHGFILFDTQFLTDHLASLGGVEISREMYHARLSQALTRRAHLIGPVPHSDEVRHLRSQTS